MTQHLQEAGQALLPGSRQWCLDWGYGEQGVHQPHRTDQEDLDHFNLSRYYVPASVLSLSNRGRKFLNVVVWLLSHVQLFATPGFPLPHHLLELAQIHVH